MKKIPCIALILLVAFPLATYGKTTSTTYNDGGDLSSTTSQQKVSSYRNQSSDLQSKIKDLSPNPIRLLSMPVLFGVTISSISPNFGDPRSGGRTHLGEDIIATKGTPIVSPTKAVVLRTEVGDSEGNAVYTANPGGETYVYMHLDRFGEGVISGTVLNPGALIGYVGDTGNAAGGSAHLHLEVHNASSTPIDPFPLLVSDLPMKEKIADLSTILKNSDNPKELANFLASNFSVEFAIAKAQGITLPSEISEAMAVAPVVSKTVTTTTVVNNNISTQNNIPNNTSRNNQINTTELQKYLISKNTGPAAVALASAGATGNFGPLTTAALAEFQVSVGINPSVGYYGPITQSYVIAHPIGSTTIVVAPINVTTSSTSTSSSVSSTRDLQLGSVGEDVRGLQVKLNSLGFTVTTSGPGSADNETTYFGPATQASVIEFQKSKGITPAVGYVGPLTRVALEIL